MTRPLHVDALMALAVAANDDVRECTSVLAPIAETPFARRTLVRTVFAYVEAWQSIQRRLLLEQHELGIIVLTRAEHALLHADAFELDRAGRPRVRPNRLPDGHRTVRFLLDATARAFALRDTPDFEAAGWSSFCSAWTIRNRITHPAHISDLTLSEHDLATVHTGYLWFCEASTHTTEQCTTLLTARLRSGV